MPSFETEKQVATAAVTLAAKVCEHVRQSLVVKPITKQDKSPVTIADFAAQAVVCQALQAAFPDDAVVAEEEANDLNPEFLQAATNSAQTVLPKATPKEVSQWIDRGNGKVNSKRYWTLDPIDGTKGFLRNDQYAVALALVADGQVQVGVLACPALELDDGPGKGILFVSVRGQGATMQALQGDDKKPQPISVSSSSSAAVDKNVCFVESFESAHTNQESHKLIAQSAGITEAIRMDSQAKYGVVASGNAALYLRLPNPNKPDYQENIWDHAAGVLLVEEAGGRVTDMEGQTLDFSKSNKLSTRGVVVSNGEIHDHVLAAIRHYEDIGKE